MIEISKDNKSGMFIITRTDSEGFHKQINISAEELRDIIGNAPYLLDRTLCPVCGGDLIWQSSVMGVERFPDVYDESDSAVVSYYRCDRCGCDYEVSEPNEEERKKLKYWNDERIKKTI